MTSPTGLRIVAPLIGLIGVLIPQLVFAQAEGILDVKCNVDGAVVFVDGELLGEAPIVEIIEDSNSENCDGSLHDFMEFYSPPRIAPKCRVLGLNAEHSLDNTTSGHDLSQHNDRVRGFKLINELA